MRTSIRVILPMLLACFLFSSCNKKNQKTSTPVPSLGTANSALPIVVTSSVASISESVATCGGTVSSTTGSSITAVGVCWAKHSNPDLKDASATTSPKLGKFVCTLTYLQANTLYHVRAYASNAYGTTYGNEVTFTTLPMWLSVGFSTGFNSMASSGGTVFGATSAEIYHTTDEGETWISYFTGVNNLYISCFAVSGNNLFIGTNGNGILQSNNLGYSWYMINTGLPNFYISQLAVSGSTLLAISSNSIFVTTNNGSTWSFSKSTASAISSVIFKGTRMFVSTQSDGVLMSTNAGVSWTSANNGFPPNIYISILGTSGDNLFASTNNGLFISSDNGGYWNTSIISIPGAVFSFYTKNSDLYMGGYGTIYLSHNNGLTFSTVTTGLSYYNGPYYLTASEKNIFALGDAIYKRALQ